MSATAASQASEPVAEQPATIRQIRVQTSAYGNVIPLVYGICRITGNIIWHGDIVATKHADPVESGGKGGGSPSTTVSYTYKGAGAFALCQGPITSIGSTTLPTDYWIDKKQYPYATPFSRFLGTYSQAPWAYLQSTHPTEAISYPGIAYAAVSGYDLKPDGSMGNHSFLVVGFLPLNFFDAIYNCNPQAVVEDFLTNPIYGAGWSASKLGSLAQYSNFCLASDSLISIAIDSQTTASSVVEKILMATNSAPVFSQGVLKIIPIGDKTLTGNGVTYAPDIAAIYNLTADDFIVSGSEDPVKCERKNPLDCYNSMPYEYTDSAKEFNRATSKVLDQAEIEASGERQGESINLDIITTASRASRIASQILQRQLYIRNRYKFRLSVRHCLIEPMDVVTITDSGLGLSLFPVRILEIEESAEGDLDVMAEEFPAGISAAETYASETASGTPLDTNFAPGDVSTPVFFESPVNESTTGLSIWVAASGINAQWGGAEVWVSLDGATYKLAGSVNGGARYGALTAVLNAGTAAVASVLLTGQGGQLITATVQDAAALSTLSWVGTVAGGEFFSYTTATLTAANAYNLVTYTRGANGTVDSSHALLQSFVRIDGSVVKGAALDPLFIGQTIYFKFISWNIYGGGKQTLSQVYAYPYLVTGTNYLRAPSTVTGQTVTVTGSRAVMSWTAVTDAALADYEVRVGATWAGGAVLGRILATEFEITNKSAGSYSLHVRARDIRGNYSAMDTPVTFSPAAPGTPTVTSVVSGTSVQLSWSATAGTIPIEKYEIRKGAVFSSAVVQGTVTATRQTFLETTPGTYTFWVFAIDTAQNSGTAASISVTV